MKNLNNSANRNLTTKVAPVSCHCKLSLLVVHLQYLAKKQDVRSVKSTPAFTEARTLFHQYI
jgi:hypothetical protein